MSATVPTPAVAGTPTPTPAAPAVPAATEPTATPAAAPADDWQAKFEAQQKVNRDLEAKLKAAIPKDEAESLRAELAKLQGKEKEFAEQQERERVQREADEKARKDAGDALVGLAIQGLAAGRLADPADALRYLSVADFPVGENYQVDQAAIVTAIEALVKSKPYLAAQGGAPGTVFESPTSRREGETKGQLTEADLDRMTPDQIVNAKAEGRLNKLLGIES